MREVVGRAIKIYRKDGLVPLLSGTKDFISNESKKNRFINSLATFYCQSRYGTADILKVGFPKSGNTWVHFLMANAIVRSAGREDTIHFKNHRDWVATSGRTPSKPPVDENFPRHYSNHADRDRQLFIDDSTKVIYVLRHPADVMESFYDYRKHRWGYDDGPFSEFIRHDEHGIPGWVRNVESWEDHWDVLIRFEDLKEDPAAKLREICGLYQRNFEESVIKYAVEQSSFENMQRLEKKYGIPAKRRANSDYNFVRKGESDRGEGWFDESDYRYLDRIAGGTMRRHGYEVPDQ